MQIGDQITVAAVQGATHATSDEVVKHVWCRQATMENSAAFVEGGLRDPTPQRLGFVLGQPLPEPAIVRVHRGVVPDHAPSADRRQGVGVLTPSLRNARITRRDLATRRHAPNRTAAGRRVLDRCRQILDRETLGLEQGSQLGGHAGLCHLCSSSANEFARSVFVGKAPGRGAERSRTAVNGFAGRCLTTRPRRLARAMVSPCLGRNARAVRVRNRLRAKPGMTGESRGRRETCSAAEGVAGEPGVHPRSLFAGRCLTTRPRRLGRPWYPPPQAVTCRPFAATTSW